MFKFFTQARQKNIPPTPLYFFNTLTRKKELFESLKPGVVKMYNCGPTVYDTQHIGNLRPYVFADTLKRVLVYNKYKVQQVINITDVGHLTSDADEGEDKVEKKAREKGMKAKDITRAVTKAFFNDLEKLNINIEQIEFPRATEHIKEQIVFIETLDDKGYTYTTSDGVYFDTSLFKKYGALGNINLEGLKEGARVKENKEKKNLTDFALWKFSKETDHRQQEWDSPWGKGFPGWHIECSAMSIKYLGKVFDIHTGGIDHIPIHHNNEIAQSEAATGKPFARYWLHNAFITIEKRKISKSVGNTIYLRNIIDRKNTPLSYKYWLLTGHYHSPMNFTWDALEGAQTALTRLHRYFVEELGKKEGNVVESYQKRFHAFINDDLDTPKALALLWELVRDDGIADEDKRATLLDFDRVLGLGLTEGDKKVKGMLLGAGKKLTVKDIPGGVKRLVEEREHARSQKNWKEADRLRDEIAKEGYRIIDSGDSPHIEKMDSQAP